MLPQIHGTQALTGGTLLLPRDFWKFSGDLRLAAVLCSRLNRLEAYAGLQLQAETEAPLLRLAQEAGGSAGSYRLCIAPEGITVSAPDREGLANGLTTLYWMVRSQQGAPACGIWTDAPKFAHRGVLLDSSRHFFSTDTIRSMIEQCSLRKLNRVHWHLSDDQGYRIESKRFPLLNEISTRRIEPDGSVSQGCYTQAEIRGIVAYAADRGVEIIPEIDVPGHVTAILAAYPHLSCDGEPVQVSAVGGIHPRILCAGKDEVLTFVKSLLEEVLELFPWHQFHLGGDEAPKDMWKACPCCQRRIRQLGLRDEEALQAWFTGELVRHLSQRGRQTIVWNEACRSQQLEASAVVQYWDEEGADEDYCAAQFAAGRSCIYSFTPNLYLDSEPCLTPLRKTFGICLQTRRGSPIPEESVQGLEAALWSERITGRERLEYMAFPRLLALAERGWGSGIAYDDFVPLCAQEIELLRADGIACCGLADADPHGSRRLQAFLEAWRPAIQAMLAYGMNPDWLLNGLFTPKLRDEFTEEQLQLCYAQLKKRSP